MYKPCTNEAYCCTPVIPAILNWSRQKDQKFKIILSHETMSKIKNQQSKIFCVIETNATWHWISTVNAAHEQSELDYWQECFNNIIQNYLQEYGVNLQRESLRKVTPETRNTTKAKGTFQKLSQFLSAESKQSLCKSSKSHTFKQEQTGQRQEEAGRW